MESVGECLASMPLDSTLKNQKKKKEYGSISYVFFMIHFFQLEIAASVSQEQNLWIQLLQIVSLFVINHFFPFGKYINFGLEYITLHMEYSLHVTSKQKLLETPHDSQSSLVPGASAMRKPGGKTV